MLRHCLILLTALIWASCASQESDSNETTDAAGEQAVDTVQVTRSMEDSSDGPVLEVGDVSHIQEVASGDAAVSTSDGIQQDMTVPEPCDTSLCDDGNPCTDALCDEVNGCVFVAKAGADCDDGNPCTQNDRCDQTVCGGEAIDCDDDNLCTDDFCSFELGCVNPANQDPCDDDDFCTIDDQCMGGICGGDPRDCEDGNACTVNSCNAASGECETVEADGGCEDGDLCTEGDTCLGGECLSGTPVTCDDENPCTDDYCDSASGCLAASNGECAKGTCQEPHLVLMSEMHTLAEEQVGASQLDYISWSECIALNVPFMGAYYFRVVIPSSGLLRLHVEFVYEGVDTTTEQYGLAWEADCDTPIQCSEAPLFDNGWTTDTPFEVHAEAGSHLFLLNHWLPIFGVIGDMDWEFVLVVEFEGDDSDISPPPPPPPPPG